MFFEIPLSVKKIITTQRAYKIIKQIITAQKAYKIIKKIWEDLPPFETARGSIGLQSGYSAAVAPTASSSGGRAVCYMGRGPTNLPPVHPAVPTFRRMNRRLGDIFAKKKFGIYI